MTSSPEEESPAAAAAAGLRAAGLLRRGGRGAGGDGLALEAALEAGLDLVPASGATIIIGAPKHRGGSGGPARIFALV